MNFRQFEARINLWPAIHFTAIVKTRRDDEYEIYAVDENNNIKSQLFICFADNESHASQLIKQFMLWLIKINGERRRQHKIERQAEAPCCRMNNRPFFSITEKQGRAESDKLSSDTNH